jgi:hypothetical protein
MSIPTRHHARLGQFESLVNSPSSGSPPPRPIRIRFGRGLGTDEPSAALISAMSVLIAEVNAERDGLRPPQPEKKPLSRKITISLAGLALNDKEIATLKERMLQRLGTLGLERDKYQFEFTHRPGDER